MRLDLGPEWVRTGADGYRHSELHVRLHINPSLPLPSDAQVDVIRESTTSSVTGWQVDLIEKRVSSPTGEVEHELHARYHIFETVAVVMVAGPPDPMAAHRSELETVVLSGRHDWSGQTACLAQLLADVDEE